MLSTLIIKVEAYSRGATIEIPSLITVNIISGKNLLKLFALFFCFITMRAQNNIQYYKDQAKIHSALIADNQNLDKANQAETQRLKAFYTKPQIGVTANYLLAPILSKDNGATTLQLAPVSAGNYYGYEFGATNGGQYQALVNVSQPLFNAGRYKTTAEQMAIASQVNQNNVKLTGHDLEKIVTDQYILCLQDTKQIAFLEEMLRLLDTQKNTLNTLINSSIYKKADGILLDIEYQNYTVQLQTYRANYQRDLLDLNIICGINDITIVLIKDEQLDLVKEEKNTGFMQKFSLDSLNVAAQQKITELKYMPLLSAFANTGLNAINLNNITNRFGVSAGLSFSYAIFDGGQKKLTRTKTDLLQKSITAYKDNFLTQNTVRKAKILQELQTYPDRLATMEKQLKEYDILLESYRKEIMSGQLSIMIYSTAIRNKLTLQRDYTLLSTQQQLLINTYNYWNW